MVSKLIVPQQQRGGAVVGGGAKQKACKAEVINKNRKALGEIGNINRPITRRFCAQLLANAQEAAQGKNKNQAALIVNGVPDRKAAQKKVTIKAKPAEVIKIITSDTVEEVVKKETLVIRRPEKKSVQTLSSVLSARSKVIITFGSLWITGFTGACGLTGKPKNPIVDIDAADVDNQLAAVEYVEDIYKFYKLAENSSRVHDYMNSQHEITEKMRAILLDWLVEVHSKFELVPETLYLTTHIVDRFLSLRAVSRKELQLVGISAMLIASKYEEIWVPEVNDLV
ncbi:hypothetical protein GIB67_037154 [Kingdonia uniflora]|uniref:Cyclin-like domain-containing protein n=1 Tax=Kingdonia uniflora TaxID=39325 RepID=A0A7J7MRN9_9MAGN|nr:hypothetical protein GIB67_037154 [Kingdonia uniflora]